MTRKTYNSINIFNISEVKMSRSYSNAVKGSCSYSQSVEHVKSQCDLELGRSLSPAERGNLFQLVSPNCIVERIQKV